MEATPEYEFHPLSCLFPLMTDAELEELAENIKVNGLNLPIILYQGKILDGRNRYLACQKAGVEPDFWEYEGDTPVQFVLSLNLKRRHLTIPQRAAIAADVANLSDGQRADYAANSNEVPVSQAEAADLLDVSLSSVQRAVRVRTADPELYQQVKAGEISLEDARRAIPTARVDDEQNVNAKEPEPDDEMARQLAECEQVISDGLQKMQDQCDESHNDLDKPDIEIEFDSLVKRLSEQRHETEWQIKSCIYGILYFLNITEGPYIPGPLGD
jgi:ParB-like chromosome segregation protein Spo0J